MTRWVLGLMIVVASYALAVTSPAVIAATTTTRHTPIVYDEPAFARVAVRSVGAAESPSTEATDAQDGSALASARDANRSTTPSSSANATNTAPRFGGHTADDLAASAAAAGRGDLTAAGRALTKHGTGERAGSSAFPALSGNPANINRIAQGQIDDILANGNLLTRTHPNHGPIIEVWAPDGRGARWYADGRFFGFLEPGS